ncbi:hypothetical protein [Photobacterium sanctipauli]|uniref:hypothetical protein n=1 Tax=Photobacterium sanctipauli TaxID=1342794 RepID=UPI000B295A12|nr:hypothetical protein [Photobacterium sanctipauli]
MKQWLNPANWKKKALVNGVVATLVLSFGLAIPTVAEAHGHKYYHKHKKHHKHKHKHHKHHHHHHHHKKVVVVKHKPKHKHYHHSRLPEIATFAIVAGATYAIIDNHFYKRRGDRYEYVERPR